MNTAVQRCSGEVKQTHIQLFYGFEQNYRVYFHI